MVFFVRVKTTAVRHEVEMLHPQCWFKHKAEVTEHETHDLWQTSDQKHLTSILLFDTLSSCASKEQLKRRLSPK